MAASNKVSICNQALSLIGRSPIVDLADGTTEAINCSVHYEPCLRLFMSERDWTFGTIRVKLSPDLDGPNFGYTYSFTIPTDSERVISVRSDDGYVRQDWIQEGGKILSNELDTNIVYLSREVTEDKLTSSAESALVHLLAARLAIAIAGNKDLANDMLGAYERIYLPKAKTSDAINSSKTDLGRFSRLTTIRRH